MDEQAYHENIAKAHRGLDEFEAWYKKNRKKVLITGAAVVVGVYILKHTGKPPAPDANKVVFETTQTALDAIDDYKNFITFAGRRGTYGLFKIS